MNITLKRTLLLFAAAASFNYSEAQKIAHLSFDSLITLMPETKTATEAAQTYFKGLEQESIAMQNEFENKYKDYMEKEAGMSDMIKKNKQEDLQQLQTRIQEFQRQAEMDFKRKQAELTAPIFQKAKKGIEAVAKEGGYKYILDTSLQNTSVLYSEASDDVLMLVKKKLDSMPLATIPGTTPPGTGGIKPPPSPGGNTPPPAKKGGK
jgi:outer membrane protein